MLAAVSYAADGPKIGVVDLQRCITESEEGKKIYQELKKKKDEMQKKLDVRQEELLKMKEDIEKQSMMLSVDAREDKEKAYERKRREFKYYYDDLSEEMAKAEQEARKGIIADLEKVVAEIGAKEKFQMIFERRSGGIMYIDKAIDITPSVLKAFDQSKKR
jgi:outer membrane protein